jgi:hypothetical protein
MVAAGRSARGEPSGHDGMLDMPERVAKVLMETTH